MANSDKDILITPNSGSSSADPKIEYVGADSSGNDTITVETLYDGTKATLSFEGSAGQLFSIVNDLTSDPIFSVNDVSGIPSIEVDSDGEIRLAEFSGNVGIGISSPTELLHVDGTIKANNLTLASLSAQNSEATAVMIDGSGIIGTRELGSNAFNSTAFLTSSSSLNATNISSGTLANARLPDLTVSDFAGSAIQTGSESFSDSDTALMTAAAVQDKILSYGYTTNVGDVTSVSASSPLSVGGGGGPSPSISFVSATITTSTSDADGDFFLVHSGTTSSGGLFKLTKANINLSGFNNDSGFLTSSSLSGYATESYVNTQVSNLVDSAPGTLDTLNELAAALGDDANFSTTVTNSIATKAPIASPSFTTKITTPQIHHTGAISVLNGSAAQGMKVGSLYVGTSYSNSAASGQVNTLNGYRVQGAEVINSSGNWVGGGNISEFTNNSGYITGNQTITLSGDVSGSGTTSIAVTIADDSHNHVISNVDGLQTALDAKLASSSYTASDVLTKIKTVDGSGSGLDADLLDGISSGSFLRSDANDAVSNTSLEISFYSNDVMETATGGQATLEVYQDTAGSDAFMQFHVSSDYAAYFGLKGDINDFAVGGWSMGANYYRVWHAGNDGSGSGLDADLLDGLQLHTGTNNVANRVVRTDGNGYIQAGWINTISGATASTLTRIYCSQDGYIRYQTPANFGVSISPHINYNTIANTPTLGGGTPYLDVATGNFGTVKVDDDRGIGWAGYAIRDDWVFMSDGAGTSGIYNDTDNDWAAIFRQNAEVELYHNGALKMETTSSGISVTGNVVATGNVTAY